MAEIQVSLKVENDSFSDLNASIENLLAEVKKLVSNGTANTDAGETLIMEWERNMKELEDSEKKLIDDFHQIMSNLNFLPGYVLAVTKGVSGLLSSDPHYCWLLGNVVIVIVICLGAMWLAMRFAYRQLLGLQAKKQELVVERDKIYQSFQTQMDSFTEDTRNSNPVLKKLQTYEIRNFELDFQAQHYHKYLLLITVCGLMYAFMLLVAGYYVLCDTKSVSHLPCIPCLRPYQVIVRTYSAADSSVICNWSNVWRITSSFEVACIYFLFRI